MGIFDKLKTQHNRQLFLPYNLRVTKGNIYIFRIARKPCRNAGAPRGKP